jgi:hypothetical protein
MRERRENRLLHRGGVRERRRKGVSRSKWKDWKRNYLKGGGEREKKGGCNQTIQTDRQTRT